MCNSKENPKCLDPRNETDPLPLTNCMTDTKLVNETKGSIQAISDLLTKVGQGSPSIYSNKKSSDFWNDDNFPMVCQKIEIEGNYESRTVARKSLSIIIE